MEKWTDAGGFDTPKDKAPFQLILQLGGPRKARVKWDLFAATNYPGRPGITGKVCSDFYRDHIYSSNRNSKVNAKRAESKVYNEKHMANVNARKKKSDENKRASQPSTSKPNRKPNKSSNMMKNPEFNPFVLNPDGDVPQPNFPPTNMEGVETVDEEDHDDEYSNQRVAKRTHVSSSDQRVAKRTRVSTSDDGANLDALTLLNSMMQNFQLDKAEEDKKREEMSNRHQAQLMDLKQQRSAMRQRQREDRDKMEERLERERTLQIQGRDEMEQAHREGQENLEQKYADEWAAENTSFNEVAKGRNEFRKSLVEVAKKAVTLKSKRAHPSSCQTPSPLPISPAFAEEVCSVPKSTSKSDGRRFVKAKRPVPVPTPLKAHVSGPPTREPNGNKQYHAVARGVDGFNGVLDTQQEALFKMHGAADPRYQAFSTREEADAFIEQNSDGDKKRTFEEEGDWPDLIHTIDVTNPPRVGLTWYLGKLYLFHDVRGDGMCLYYCLSDLGVVDVDGNPLDGQGIRRTLAAILNNVSGSPHGDHQLQQARCILAGWMRYNFQNPDDAEDGLNALVEKMKVRLSMTEEEIQAIRDRNADRLDRKKRGDFSKGPMEELPYGEIEDVILLAFFTKKWRIRCVHHFSDKLSEYDIGYILQLICKGEDPERNGGRPLMPDNELALYFTQEDLAPPEMVDFLLLHHEDGNHTNPNGYHMHYARFLDLESVDPIYRPPLYEDTPIYLGGTKWTTFSNLERWIPSWLNRGLKRAKL